MTNDIRRAQRSMRVFISYSRKDAAFAELLRAGLNERGFDAYLDRQDILPGEDWRRRLDGLILAADAVVFVISPDSLASKHCAWEVERALELNKILTPLRWRAAHGALGHAELSRLNAVLFEEFEKSDSTDLMALASAMESLETALSVRDLLWVREHTKWVARASEWESGNPGRLEGKLLRADDIAAVEAWIRLRPLSVPDVPSVLLDYLAASKAKEADDRKRLAFEFARFAAAREYADAFFHVERDYLTREIADLRARTDDVAVDLRLSAQADLTMLEAIISADSVKWHPEPAEYVGVVMLSSPNQPANDHYRFPCCDRHLYQLQHAPSQFRLDGCEDGPKSSRDVAGVRTIHNEPRNHLPLELFDWTARPPQLKSSEEHRARLAGLDAGSAEKPRKKRLFSW
jgi:hypothetical protein